jgi:phosphatidylglycerol---prolipoprotein diacylglyceryl transferase
LSAAYVAVMLGSMATGVLVSSRLPRPTGLTRTQRLIVSMGALAGGCLGAKAPFLVLDPRALTTLGVWLENGRTITYGLVGGYLGVEAAKWAAGIKVKTGDSLVVPLAASVAVGRLGCFVGGCCYGAATSVPWSVDFGDGVARHPTQLYEFVFHASAAVLLWQAGLRGLFERQRVKLYIAAYLVYRFLTEWIRPEPRMALGLTFYQLSVPPMLALFAWLAWVDRPGRVVG